MDDPIAQFLASPRVDNQSASVVQFGDGKLVPLVVVLALLAGTAIAISIASMHESAKAERETRMLEYYVLEVDGKLINAGIIRPEESWSTKKQKSKESEK